VKLGGKELTQENMAELEAKKQQEKEMRDDMLGRILTPEAQDRLKRVALVKPQVAEAVETNLLNKARSGQIASKIDEDAVKGMLKAAGEQRPTVSKVTIQRKNYFDDEDSDDNDDDLL